MLNDTHTPHTHKSFAVEKRRHSFFNGPGSTWNKLVDFVDNQKKVIKRYHSFDFLSLPSSHIAIHRSKAKKCKRTLFNFSWIIKSAKHSHNTHTDINVLRSDVRTYAHTLYVSAFITYWVPVRLNELEWMAANLQNVMSWKRFETICVWLIE